MLDDFDWDAKGVSPMEECPDVGVEVRMPQDLPGDYVAGLMR